ncbi:MAG: peptide synthase, partial [Pseudomonadota bacterium]
MMVATALRIAALSHGATVVLIDPGIGRKHLIKCLSEARPDGFVGIPKAQAIRTLLRRRFPQAAFNVTICRKYFWGGKTLQQIIAMGSTKEEPGSD